MRRTRREALRVLTVKFIRTWEMGSSTMICLTSYLCSSDTLNVTLASLLLFCSEVMWGVGWYTVSNWVRMNRWRIANDTSLSTSDVHTVYVIELSKVWDMMKAAIFLMVFLRRFWNFIFLRMRLVCDPRSSDFRLASPFAFCFPFRSSSVSESMQISAE